MDKDREEFQHDWYGILGCEPGTSKELIEKAARKLAAKNHPDKTSDPDAPAKFLLIQKAKEILTDDGKKKVIDDHHAQSRKRKEYEETRWKGMDEQRKRFREQLDGRISSAKAIDPNEVLRQELKKQTKVMEGMRRANQEAMARAAEQEAQRAAAKNDSLQGYRQALAEDSVLRQRQVKVKWKRTAQSQSEDSLCALLRGCGPVDEVVLLPKGTSALVTFASEEGARRAVQQFAGSAELRVAAVEEQATPRAKVFTHSYTSSHGLNDQLAKEIQRAKETEELRRRAGGEAEGRGAMDYAAFLAKEQRVLALMRQFKPSDS